MTDLRHVRTSRLLLDAVVPEDLDAHFALMSDPAVWRHLPAGRHTHPAATAEGIRRVQEHWADRGLGYWTARLRPDLSAEQVPPRSSPGSFVGTGGCAVRDGTAGWNLYYRFTRAAWGTGLAAELVSEAIDAAHAIDPDLPVVAYPLENNLESKGRAERSGLTLVWRGPDAGNPDPEAVRLVYADRPISGDMVDRIAATH